MSIKAKSIFTGSIAFIIFASFRNFIPFSNMIFYVISCAVFVVITLFSYSFLYSKKETASPTNIKIWSILPVAALCIWMVLFYVNEPKAEHSLEV